MGFSIPPAPFDADLQLRSPHQKTGLAGNGSGPAVGRNYLYKTGA
jgi:hypothetical protein